MFDLSGCNMRACRCVFSERRTDQPEPPCAAGWAARAPTPCAAAWLRGNGQRKGQMPTCEQGKQPAKRTLRLVLRFRSSAALLLVAAHRGLRSLQARQLLDNVLRIRLLRARGAARRRQRRCNSGRRRRRHLAGRDVARHVGIVALVGAVDSARLGREHARIALRELFTERASGE